MYWMLFQLGKYGYGINTDYIIEVMPLVPLQSVLGVPLFIVGVFNYRGKIIPVMDLKLMSFGESSTPRLNTRILITQLNVESEADLVIGIIVEYATQAIEVDSNDLQDSNLNTTDLPYLGKFIKYGDELIRYIDVTTILDKTQKEKLFAKKTLHGK